ncbi:hypothetical protein BDW60DRAFT_193846 [Aspergillus nidulans var. acristatus]
MYIQHQHAICIACFCISGIWSISDCTPSISAIFILPFFLDYWISFSFFIIAVETSCRIWQSG